MKPYTLGSLFSGIGGIDLAFEEAGFIISWQVEIEEFPTRILEQEWPHVHRARDIRGCTGRDGKGWRRYHYLERVDVIAGGFPCQDISVAGRGAGIREGTRSGLWIEFARLISELRPRCVLLENVPAITRRGGARVLADLASMGYVGHAGIISAHDAGALHMRKRWFAVAYDSRFRVQRSTAESFQGQPKLSQIKNGRRLAPLRERSDIHAPELCGSSDGVPDRVDRIKALGNAVVPQVIYPIAVKMYQRLAEIDGIRT